ncbi:MAG: AsnC family transcriptional regulator [Chloroflexi bacterium]|nr:Lrp/AsnC ligand binding domain-containing protein [Anaerolineaceae bacterium]NMB90565.1 AsnC family transcriptional regulator [Chloroflexota bacterium]
MDLPIDELDKKIVDLLIEDGRMSSADIARTIGDVTERTVRYRIQQLIEKGVISVSAVVDPTKIGFPVIADVFIEVEPGRVLEVARRLAEFDLITYVACATGERDISVQIAARSNTELYQFVTDNLGNIPSVRRTTTSIVPLIIKDDSKWHIPYSVFKKDQD